MLNDVENIPLSKNIIVVCLSFTRIPTTSIQRYRQLADRDQPLDSNNTSYISYAIQCIELVPRFSNFEPICTNMYRISPSDGDVSHYTLRLKTSGATPAYIQNFPLSTFCFT